MNEKPILFNTEMVRAILDGKKTQTRRLVKNLPLEEPYATVDEDGLWISDEDGDWYRAEAFSPIKSGDILWVRETWMEENEYAGLSDRTMYFYKASDPERKGCWRPSIHMPKEAARIWLLVTDVRPERLKNISATDAMEEGFTDWNDFVRVWNSTIKKSDLRTYGWDANPWVWVIEFTRIDYYGW